MLRTAEPRTPETRTTPETAAAPAVNGHAVNGNGSPPANGAAAGNGAAHAPAPACCTPPLEAVWLERVETPPLRRTPGDVEPADVLPSPVAEG